MLTTKEQEKLKDILFSETFDITYESWSFCDSDSYHICNVKSEHFKIYSCRNPNTSSISAKVFYIDKEDEINVSNWILDEELVDILKNAKKRQEELLRKAEEEKKEREENILRKFIKKFK